jgi:hypothetical protein
VLLHAQKLNSSSSSSSKAQPQQQMLQMWPQQL